MAKLLPKMDKIHQNRQIAQKSPKMAKLPQNRQKWPKMAKLIQNEPKWPNCSKIAQTGQIAPKSPKMVTKWTKIVENGRKCLKMANFWRCSNLAIFGYSAAIWPFWDSFGDFGAIWRF